LKSLRNIIKIPVTNRARRIKGETSKLLKGVLEEKRREIIKECAPRKLGSSYR